MLGKMIDYSENKKELELNVAPDIKNKDFPNKYYRS